MKRATAESFMTVSNVTAEGMQAGRTGRSSLSICLCAVLVLGCSGDRLGSKARTSRGPGPYLYRDLSFNGKLLLVGDSLWDVESGKELRHGEVQPRGVPQRFVTASRFSPDGRRVLIASARNAGAGLIVGGAVEVHDTVTGEIIVRFSPQDGYLFDAQFSPDGKRILTVDMSDTIHIWDAGSGQKLLVMKGLWIPHSVPSVRFVSFSPDGRRVLVLSYEKVTVFHATTHEQICQFKAPKETARPDFFVSTQFSPDGKLVLTEQCNGVTRIWDAVTGQQTQFFAAVSTSDRFWPYAIFTPEGRRVISGSDDGMAILWDLTTAKEIRRFQALGLERGPIDEMIISNDGKRLITVCSETEYPNSGVRNSSARRSAVLWDADTGQEIRQLPNQEQIADFSPVGHTFITVKNGKPSALYDGARGDCVCRYDEN